MSKHSRCIIDIDPAAETENVQPNKRCRFMPFPSPLGPSFTSIDPIMAAACQPSPSPNPAASGSGTIFSFQQPSPGQQAAPPPGGFFSQLPAHPVSAPSSMMSNRLLTAAASIDSLNQELEHIFCCPGRHESQRHAMHCLLQLLRHQNAVVSTNAANSLWVICERGREYFDQLVHLGLLEVATSLARVSHLTEWCLAVIERAAPCYRSRLLQTNVTTIVQSLVQSGPAGNQAAAMRVLALLDSDWWKKCMVSRWQEPFTPTRRCPF